MKRLNDTNYKSDLLEQEGTFLVDFSATWCGPCKMLHPVLDALEAEYAGKVTFCDVDVDESPEFTISNGISSVPTVLLYKNGQVVSKFVGYRPESEVRAFLG